MVNSQQPLVPVESGCQALGVQAENRDLVLVNVPCLVALLFAVDFQLTPLLFESAGTPDKTVLVMTILWQLVDGESCDCTSL